MLTHAGRAAASQLNKVPFQAPLVAARKGLWSKTQSKFRVRVRVKGYGFGVCFKSRILLQKCAEHDE